MAKLQNIVFYFRNYWKVTLFSIAMMSLFEILDLFVPYAIGQILNILSGQAVDRPMQSVIQGIAHLAGASDSRDRTFALAVLLSLVFIISVGRAPIQPWLGAWFSWDTAFRARRENAERAIQKVLTLPLEFYDENNPGRISARVAKGLSNHTWSYPEVVGQLFPRFFRVIGIFVVVWFIEWRIALLLLLCFVGIVGFNMLGLKRLSAQEEKLDKYMEDTESRTSEIITNIKTVKAFATETSELKRQRQRLDREFKVLDYRIHRGYVKLGMYERTVVQSSVFLVFVLTVMATAQGMISLGHFITTFTVSSMAFAEVEPISQVAEFLARRYGSMIRFHEFMQLPVGTDASAVSVRRNVGKTKASSNTDPSIPTYQFTGKVEFSHLTFGYASDRPVLNDINLLIEPYQTVALVGRSGSGKSTLVKLLFRYFEPNQGAILVDGQDIRRLDITGYRKRLAIVHQEVDIFNGTLLENLTYGNPGASMEQVREACRIAQADDFIHQMPAKYSTIVGERGVRLSGGQRQRIGIARALIVDPDVLIFDEATSSLDYESERSIQLAMRSLLGTRTLIIIAHRLSTIREADKIVVLDQGNIVEVGSHEELLQHGGIYQRLHALQETGELLA
ncbi:ABC transporter ATP-binding protein [Myxacorys almedinensis]|uniref:ATP-binding cassette domain-containing protein n=1 Tax=Myxacorys almedinensis A TaxID=2690445 RepID=A0A8J7Z9S5_9CYAN|nr:ABC transporter ATP-binding protein [Myxacorys almedinensis]NDJ18030.1 ATP-binding cassette domain-containing protein [Myxacorys almedinensis A]